MKDREYLQEMAYIAAEKEDLEQKELRELDQLRKPAKIIIQYHDGKRYRKLNRFNLNPVSLRGNY
jgi:hypothetical protein